MNHAIYSRLAWLNIKNNRKIYLPYLLTGLCMVMIFYIMGFLCFNQEVMNMAGGKFLCTIIYLGLYVIGVFSVLFLFYTNSFIMKRRKKEFGLYNVLGMGKRHIARVMLCENLMVASCCLLGGLLTGIVFSKLAQMFLFHLMNKVAGYAFRIDWRFAAFTIAVFAAIYLLILLDSLRQVYRSKPIELLQGSSSGEKEPRANDGCS